jgi:hypothetical protein
MSFGSPSRGRLPQPVLVGLSALGYAVTIAIVAFIATQPGCGHDTIIWDRVGDQIREGVSPYGGDYPAIELFFYAPPWAVIFAAISWVPREAVVAGLMVLEVIAWRVCAGSWRRVGYLGLLPIFGFELAVGQINLLIAAAVALALRGDGRWAVLAALAKLSPALAIREVKRPILVLLVCLAVTVPVFGLWLDWVRQLVAATSVIASPVPYAVRLAVAGGFLLLRRPWATGLAVIIAIPNPTANVYVLVAALMPGKRATDASSSVG